MLVKHHYMGDEANMYKEMYTGIVLHVSSMPAN